MKLENVKGTFDYSMKEQEIREYIKDTLKKIFKRYGYSPLETPILCYYDLLTLKYNKDDEIVKEIYKATDQGNRQLGLRYDLTVPFAKFIATEKGLRLPYKRYEIGEAFRDGPVKVGRNRQFVQCDVDVVGLEGQVVEAELISMFIEGYNELSIPVEIQYNSRKLMQGLIENLKIDFIDISEVIKIIDKMKKISEVDFKNELSNLKIEETKQSLLLRYFRMSLKEIKKEFNNTDNINIIEGLNELEELIDLLDYQGLTAYLKFTPTLARGQSYYTGNVFEAYAIDSDIKSSIGGGGRYDKMITEWIDDGNIYPSVGVSFGLNVIYEIIKNREELINKQSIDVFIIPMGTYKESLLLANEIRKLGINVEIELKIGKIKKSFEYANRENIPYVIVVIGEKEVNENKFKIKNMNTGVEITVAYNEIKDKINELFYKIC